MRRTRAAGMLLLLAGSPALARAAPELAFRRDGVEVRRLDLDTLKRGCGASAVEVDDPYYGARKTFLACPLACAVALGFGAPVAPEADVLLHALDGYTKPSTGARLAEAGGFLAFAEAARAGGPGSPWEPIGRQRVDPGPFYLVWAGAAQRDTHRYPWPYQLAAIEVTDFTRRYPHTVPRTAPPGSPAWTGFAVFRADCVACHAVNREGGTVGPDLNLPRSIVEYRPVEQVKAYVRDPGAFRYTSMPSHPHLSARELDGLIAYFRTMRTLKHDPARAE